MKVNKATELKKKIVEFSVYNKKSTRLNKTQHNTIHNIQFEGDFISAGDCFQFFFIILEGDYYVREEEVRSFKIH